MVGFWRELVFIFFLVLDGVFCIFCSDCKRELFLLLVFCLLFIILVNGLLGLKLDRDINDIFGGVLVFKDLFEGFILVKLWVGFVVIFLWDFFSIDWNFDLGLVVDVFVVVYVVGVVFWLFLFELLIIVVFSVDSWGCGGLVNVLISCLDVGV